MDIDPNANLNEVPMSKLKQLLQLYNLLSPENRLDLIRRCQRRFLIEDDVQHLESSNDEHMFFGLIHKLSDRDVCFKKFEDILKTVVGDVHVLNASECKKSNKQIGMYAPKISRQPISLIKCYNENAIFEVEVHANVHSERPSFQWFHNDHTIEDNDSITGCTKQKLEINSLKHVDKGNYHVLISNPFGLKKSNVVHLDIVTRDDLDDLVTIRKNPSTKVVEHGSEVFFSITVRSIMSLRYQWYHEGQKLNQQTSEFFFIQHAEPCEHNGDYLCEVSLVEYPDIKVLSKTANLKVISLSGTTYTASDKIAFLVGNRSYVTHKRLNAVYNDLLSLKCKLESMHFKVLCYLDLEKFELINALKFLNKLLCKGVYVALYFGGHGYEHIEEGSQLLCIETDGVSNFISLNCILESIVEKKPSLIFVMWDICRTLSNDPPTHSVRGQINRKKVENYYIFYAASYGDKALEIEEESGIFIQCLSNVIDLNCSLSQMADSFKLDFINRPDYDIIKEMTPQFDSNLLDNRGLRDMIHFIGSSSDQDNHETNLQELMYVPKQQKRSFDFCDIVIDFKQLFTNILIVSFQAISTDFSHKVLRLTVSKIQKSKNENFQFKFDNQPIIGNVLNVEFHDIQKLKKDLKFIIQMKVQNPHNDEDFLLECQKITVGKLSHAVLLRNST